MKHIFLKRGKMSFFCDFSVARQIFFEIQKNIRQIGDNAFFSHTKLS